MKSKTIKWLYDVPKSKKIYILILTLLQAINGASGVLYAILLRDIVDSAVNQNETGFWNSVFLVIALVIAQILIRSIFRWMAELSKSTFENIFKQRILKNILHKDFEKVSSIHSAEWLNRLTNDTVVVSNGYVEIIPNLVGMLVKMLSAVIMLIIIDWRFACIIIPGAIIISIITYAFRKTLKKLHKKMQEKDGKLRIFLQEHISSLMIIRTFSAEDQTQKEADIKMLEHKKARMRKNYFSNFCNTGFSIAMDGMYLFGICYCGYGIMIGTISYGTLMAITQLISQIQSPFANITGYLPKFYAMLASAERIMEIETLKDDIQEKYDLDYIRQYYSNSFGSIVLKNVNYRYYQALNDIENFSKGNMPVVINNISLEIKKGDCVAIVGQSGCGKSTILKILMCIYQIDKGKRLLVGKNGEEKLLNEKWQRLFAYVPQGNFLMTGTIRDVICFADKQNIDEERIKKALKIACADEFVDKLENGIGTTLGENGTGLSEGQMQRIAIARAIYSDNPILILDESTSALDENTEKRLIDNLRKMTNKTIIIVTHRPYALNICDKVIKLGDGKS